MAIDQYGRFIRTAPAPRVSSNYNSPSSSATYSYGRSESLWDRFNNCIASIGNWIDDIIETVSEWLTTIGIIIGAISLICWIFNDSNIFYIVLRGIGACFIGGLMFYVIAINSFIISLILKGIRFIFWNGWTLLMALTIVFGVWTYVAFSSPSYDYTPVTDTEVYTPTYDKYRCTVAVLNVRINPNKTSRVIGTLRKGQEVEVIDKENGFATIKYNGQWGYASLDYLAEMK